MSNSARYLPSDWVLPAVDQWNRAFFTSGEIRLQKCARCAKVQHPPIEICNVCQGFEFEYVAVSPHGLIDSFTIVHHPVHAALKDVVPYNVCVIALSEYPDVRIVGNIIDATASQIAIGRPVTATWTMLASDDEQFALPQWKLNEADL